MLLRLLIGVCCRPLSHPPCHTRRTCRRRASPRTMNRRSSESGRGCGPSKGGGTSTRSPPTRLDTQVPRCPPWAPTPSRVRTTTAVHPPPRGRPSPTTGCCHTDARFNDASISHRDYIANEPMMPDTFFLEPSPPILQQ